MDILCDAAGLVAGTDAAKGPEGASSGRSSSEAPNAPASPRELFSAGHFVAAVVATSTLIPACASDASPTAVLELWYLRLQSLLVLQLGHIAAEEIGHNLRPLSADEPASDLFAAPAARHAAWRLRLLIVPVKTRGINAAAIQQYYTLAAAARKEAEAESAAAARDGGDDTTEDGEEAGTAPDNDESVSAAEWLRGVELAGLYVLSALIAMRDYMTAVQLLKVHYGATRKEQFAEVLALLHVLIGDTLGAQAWSQRVAKPQRAAVHDLVKFADEDLGERLPSAGVGGVAQMYEGRVFESIDTLEAEFFHERAASADSVALSNLFVLYDLCFTDAKDRRADLARRLHAARGVSGEDRERLRASARSVPSS